MHVKIYQNDAVLAALYLRGLSRAACASRRQWPKVLSSLRCAGVTGASVTEILMERGLWVEARILENTAILDRAQRLVEQGRCLCASSNEYPQRWLKLGAAAPPTFWKMGEVPSGSFVGVVGSREAAPEVLQFAAEVTKEAVRLGYGLLSGGARGCDSAAARSCRRACGELIEMWPHGLGAQRRRQTGSCVLSACAPEEEFSTGNAMERNALIYSGAVCTVVCHARFRAGGSWWGAVDALRHRNRVLVRHDPSEPGLVALEALGAVPLHHPSGLAEAIASATVPTDLFTAMAAG